MGMRNLKRKEKKTRRKERNKTKKRKLEGKTK